MNEEWMNEWMNEWDRPTNFKHTCFSSSVSDSRSAASTQHLVSEMTDYVSSRTLNSTHSLHGITFAVAGPWLHVFGICCQRCYIWWMTACALRICWKHICLTEAAVLSDFCLLTYLLHLLPSQTWSQHYYLYQKHSTLL